MIDIWLVVKNLFNVYFLFVKRDSWVVGTLVSVGSRLNSGKWASSSLPSILGYAQIIVFLRV